MFELLFRHQLFFYAKNYLLNPIEYLIIRNIRHNSMQIVERKIKWKIQRKIQKQVKL